MAWKSRILLAVSRIAKKPAITKIAGFIRVEQRSCGTGILPVLTLKMRAPLIVIFQAEVGNQILTAQVPQRVL
jgi:hypothetical protein